MPYAAANGLLAALAFLVAGHAPVGGLFLAALALQAVLWSLLPGWWAKRAGA
ncbi:MAG: hypothetical protein V2J24_15110 [Pseudomonadales bacterium]|jgi:hypothetical protein|nr:hypothetical protein [Pseudomonadales bacterium]